MTAAPQDLESFVRLSRRALWMALGIILFLGTGATVLVAVPGSEAAAMASKLMLFLPLVIVFALAVLRGAAKGASLDASGPGMQAIVNDELRQAALRSAYRNAFVALLLAQPLLGILLTWQPVAYPLAVMGAACSLGGIAVFLASLLYYDR